MKEELCLALHGSGILHCFLFIMKNAFGIDLITTYIDANSLQPSSSLEHVTDRAECNHDCLEGRQLRFKCIKNTRQNRRRLYRNRYPEKLNLRHRAHCKTRTKHRTLRMFFPCSWSPAKYAGYSKLHCAEFWPLVRKFKLAFVQWKIAALVRAWLLRYR